MVNPQYRIDYSDEKGTARERIRLMKEIFECSVVSGHLGEVELPQPRNNRGYCPRLQCSNWKNTPVISLLFIFHFSFFIHLFPHPCARYGFFSTVFQSY